MVTPFDDDGRARPRGRADLARWLVEHGNDGLVLAGTTGEARARPTTSRSRCGRRCGPRSTCRSSPGARATTPPTGPPHRAGHRTPASTAILAVTPVLQPPVPGRHRGPLPGRRRRNRPAGDDLRHPGPHRPQDRHRGAAAAGPRGAQHGRPQGRGRQPGRDGEAHRRRAAGFEVYSGDDGLTLPLLAVGAVGMHRRGDPLGRRAGRPR